MSSGVFLVDRSVLDLCEETYHNPSGMCFDTMNICDMSRRWKAVVACVNAKLNGLASHCDMILEDYSPFLVLPFPLDTLVGDILNLCKKRGLPVVAEVSGYDEKCVVVASYFDPWSRWFELMFGDLEEKICDKEKEELASVIVQLMTTIRLCVANN